MVKARRGGRDGMGKKDIVCPKCGYAMIFKTSLNNVFKKQNLSKNHKH